MGGNQSIAVDGPAVYTLIVTNIDTAAACPDTTFSLVILSGAGNIASISLPSVPSVSSVTVLPSTNDTAGHHKTAAIDAKITTARSSFVLRFSVSYVVQPVLLRAIGQVIYPISYTHLRHV